MSFMAWTCRTKETHCRASIFMVVGFGLATLGGDCDGDVVEDPTFRDWCGSALCAWHLDTGQVRPEPTWNTNDPGVGFVETPTQISQATQESAARCLLFTSVADLDPLADVTLSVDFNSDGSIEYTGPLGAARWDQVQQEITAPEAYQGITFYVRKSGSGRAVLAEIRIQSTSGCTAPAVAIPAGTLALGETCAESTDCTAGLTCAGTGGYLICSQCSASVPCGGDGGGACVARSVFMPMQCGPGEGLGKAGDGCLTGSDCASEDCEGAAPVSLVADAGRCQLDAATGDADPGNCVWYGARGGACR
jgi:hypothetical protein